MPKLTNHLFLHTTSDGLKYQFESEIHVNVEGEFSCTVPEYLMESLSAVGKERSKQKGTAFYAKQLKVNHRAFAQSKADLIHYVDEAHRQHYQAEVTHDLIICYDWFSEVSYWLNPDGTMSANGSMPDAAQRHNDGTGGNWVEHRSKSGTSINATNTVHHFSVGLFASVVKRTSHTRLSGTNVTWERISQFGNRSDLGEWGFKLTGLCGISPPKSPEHLRQMPYTEDAAKFFYESMMAMCEMGHHFKAFFGDESNVMAAIEGNGQFLLGGPSTAPGGQSDTIKETPEG